MCTHGGNGPRERALLQVRPPSRLSPPTVAFYIRLLPGCQSVRRDDSEGSGGRSSGHTRASTSTGHTSSSHIVFKALQRGRLQRGGQCVAKGEGSNRQYRGGAGCGEAATSPAATTKRRWGGGFPLWDPDGVEAGNWRVEKATVPTTNLLQRPRRHELFTLISAGTRVAVPV